MDLCRPATRNEAVALMECYAADEPQVLRRDFFNSLLAVFEPDEVRLQWVEADLNSLRVEVVSDGHLAIIGLLPPF